MSRGDFRVISVDDWVAITAFVLDTDHSVIRRVAKLDLADSALAAPIAGSGTIDVYPSVSEKAAVLCHRLIKNHPLPDGNKRTAFVIMVTFLKWNGCSWTIPDVHDAVEMMIRVASDEVTIDELAEWIRRHIDQGED